MIRLCSGPLLGIEIKTDQKEMEKKKKKPCFPIADWVLPETLF